MTCTVIMTTWQGAAFVERQLDSLLCQTRSPDEVLIFDDASTDATAVIVKTFIEKHNLKLWKFFTNSQNLGWKKNFMQGLRAAQGELLFPCDQDDIWHPNKLQRMEEAMAMQPEIELLACGMKIKYDEGAVKTKHPAANEIVSEERPIRYPFTKHFFMCPYPGCTYAIRKSFFDRVNIAWQNDFPHDEFLWISALLEDGAYYLKQPLITFCRHVGNASDIRYKDIAMQKKQLDYIERALESFLQLVNNAALTVNTTRIKQLAVAQVWCQKRKKLMETRNPLRWLELAPYFPYYNSAANALSDLYLVLFGSFTRKTH